MNNMAAAFQVLLLYTLGCYLQIRGNTELRICKRLCKDELRYTHCEDDKQCKVLTYVSKNDSTSNLLECDCRMNYCTRICPGCTGKGCRSSVLKFNTDTNTGKHYPIECDCNEKKYPPKVISDPALVRKLKQKSACTRICDPKIRHRMCPAQPPCIVTRVYRVKGKQYERRCYCDTEKYSVIIWRHDKF
ncbi:Uncharacterised protein at_DN1698 [Pycnogonum litorale]